MKAIKLEAPKAFRRFDLPDPGRPAEGEALVRVQRVGICGTDVVRYLRWLAKVPGLPHFFEAFLLINTTLFCSRRLAAMQRLEDLVLQVPGVRSKVHRLGGIEFVEETGRELGHLHGNGLLDVPVGRTATIRIALPSADCSFFVRCCSSRQCGH